MALWRSRSLAEIVAGSRFRHRHPDCVVETARVLSIGQDPCGIPHVRFMVSYERSARTVLEEGPRVLSVAALASHYREPAQA